MANTEGNFNCLQKVQMIEMLVKPSVFGHNVCRHKIFTDRVTACVSGPAGQAVTSSSSSSCS